MDLKKIKQLMAVPIEFQDVHLEVQDIEKAAHQADFWVDFHKHPWFEFNYVHSGTFSVSVQETEFVASAGECFMILPGVMHSNKFNTPDDGFCLRFTLYKIPNKDGCEFHDNLLKTLVASVSCPLKLNIASLLTSNSLYALQMAFLSLLIEIFELFNPNTPIVNLVNSDLANKVILYLNKNYNSKIYVSSIAKEFNVSYSTLSRKFKSETGISIIEKLTDIRVSAAKPLLLNSNYTLSQIANMVGFENEYYFSKAFKKSSGSTPSVFRKRIKCE